jgi:hypothetical protein
MCQRFFLSKKRPKPAFSFFLETNNNQACLSSFYVCVVNFSLDARSES